jgi:hypothetical protein
MINFFRKIRKKLADDNKPLKYVRYVIGEIVLVVFGILIALQINNWNESKKLDLKKQDLIYRLTEQVSKNIANSLYQIESEKERVNKITALMLMIGKPFEQNSQRKLDTLMSYSMYDFSFFLDLNTLTEAKDNGEISLIKNDSLRSWLYGFISYKNIIQQRILIANNDNNNYYVPYLYKNINLRSQYANEDESYRNRIGYSKLKKNNYDQILMDREFENLLSLRLDYAEEFLSTFQNLNGNLEFLKELLDKEK